MIKIMTDLKLDIVSQEGLWEELGLRGGVLPLCVMETTLQEELCAHNRALWL